MSSGLNLLGAVFHFTNIEFPNGGGLKTDSAVVEAAVAVGILGATAYGLYKLFDSETETEE